MSFVLGKSNDTAEMRGTLPGNYKTNYWNILIVEINIGVGTQTYTHKRTHACMDVYPHAQTLAYAHMHACTYARMHTQTHTHLCKHTHLRAHTQCCL